jgi:hypothetical protein
MVCNLQQILDEGQLKYCDETNMKKVSEAKKVYRECWRKNLKETRKDNWDPEQGKFREELIRNEGYVPYPEKSKLRWFMIERTKEIETQAGIGWSFARRVYFQKLEAKMIEQEWERFWEENKEEIYSYLGREVPIPFNPSVMINISPNWKGKFNAISEHGSGVDWLTNKLMIKKFQIVIEKYLKASNRYSKWKYNLECGGEGNHLHAHIVAEIRPGSYKSVMTHINKGNHRNEICKIWDQTFPEGYQRVCKGKFSIQRILLRNEELLKDKLKYLIENEKPEGHKNLNDLGILVNEGF